jgi:hypothetical protein
MNTNYNCSWLGNLSRYFSPCWGNLAYFFPKKFKLLNILFSISFEFERIWWRLFQKCLVTTKLYIYVLFQLFLTCNALLHLIFSLQCVRPNLIPVLPFNFACSIFDIPYSYTYSQTRLKEYLYIANHCL